MNSRILIVAPNSNFPRLAGVAEDAAAWRLHFNSGRVPTVGRLANPTSEAAGAQPAADRGGA